MGGRFQTVAVIAHRAAGPLAILILIVVGAATPTRAGDIIDLGIADQFTLSQPIVQIAIADEGRVFDLAPYNECLLDTGASGILMAKTASDELRAAGLVEEATYIDFGVAGPQATGVSAPYDFSFAGNDGVPLTMPDVRFQTSGSDFAFYGGIAGMPLMMGRTVGLDLPRQADVNALRMGVAFGADPLPPPTTHSYSIPLSMYEFPMTGQVDPDDPLPIYAPLPFAPVELQFGTSRKTSSFLLDTGAQQCILSSGMAFELGLDVNGNGDLEDEAVTFQEVIGVGGSKIIPVLQIDALALQAGDGTALMFRDVAVGIIDIDDALPGVLGMNILNAGWEIYALNTVLGVDPLGPPGVFDRIDLDFRDAAATMAAEMRLTVRGDADVAVSQGPLSVEVTAGTLWQAAAGHASIGGIGTLEKTGAGTLVLDAVNTLTGTTTVTAGTLEIAAAKALFGSPVTVEAGATLAVADGITPRLPSLSLDGGTLAAATVTVDAAAGIRSLTINSGTVAATAALVVGAGGLVDLPDADRVSIGVASLAVAETNGGGKIDLGSGQVSIAAGGIAAADLRADIIAGRNGGAWDGPAGITSAGAASSNGARAVGYTVAGDGSARVSFAAPGDTNLDGIVDLIDLLAILGSGTYDQPMAAVWDQGDFNYDGVTDLLDLLGILGSGTYDQGDYFPAAATVNRFAGTVAAVPEPGTTGWVLVAAAAILRARRRR
jgi:autotransporter-associated beta strand protein